MTYKIVRNFFNDNVSNKTIANGLTLEEAQEHCRDKETSSSSCTTKEARNRTKQYGEWFDSYTEE